MSLQTPDDRAATLYKCTHCGHRTLAVDPDACDRCGGPLVAMNTLTH